MSVGFVMLVHRDFDRAGDVVRHLAGQGAPVVVHVDARAHGPEVARFRMLARGLSGVRLSRRFACEWGMWPIVEATSAAARELLDAFPEVRNVALLSGACLPLRPVSELRAFLAARPGTDFIESVAVEDVAWTCGGLEGERFTLWFPFPWKKRRRIFDAFVEVQRKLGVRRKPPAGLVPHMGSQWWCLTRETLEAIFADPDRAVYERFFRRSWIPDESYFQTLARKHSRRIESRSLTFARFDCDGRPHVFYDDHYALLAGSGQFFARKVWRGANRLYSGFLSAAAAAGAVRARDLDEVLEASATTRRHGRRGLVMQGRFAPWAQGETARPYAVLQGFDQLFEDLPGWLGRVSGATVHGRLMHPERIEHAGDALPGGLSASVALRDYDPAAFVRNLLWSTRDRRQVMLCAPGDAEALWPGLANDANARIALVTGAWAIGLWQAGGDFAETCRAAARLQRLEAAQVASLPRPLPDRVRVWTLAQVLERPAETLRWVVQASADGAATGPGEAPRMRRLEGLSGFLGRLRDAGYPVSIAGEIKPSDECRDVVRQAR